MSRRPDQKPKAIHDDAERLGLVFKRLLESEDDVWAPAEKRRLLKLLNPLIAAYRSKCIDVGSIKRRAAVHINGNGALRKGSERTTSA